MEKLNDKEVTHTIAEEDAQIALRGTTRILIGGMDGAGKSTFACSLYLRLKQEGVDTSLHEIDRWSDTHEPILGHKPWALRQKRSEIPHEEFYEAVEAFKHDEHAIVLGDMQGRSQYRHNHALSGAADYGILMTRETTEKDARVPFPQTEQAWEDLYARTLNTPIALHIRSLRTDQHAPEGYVGVEGLEREPLPCHPRIRQIAATVIQLAHMKEGVHAESRAR